MVTENPRKTHEKNLKKAQPNFQDFNEDESHLGLGPGCPIRPPSPFLIIANKILKGPVILNIGGKK